MIRLILLKKYEDMISKVIRMPDNGMYGALSKGIMMAAGDIIGILNSDDFHETPLLNTPFCHEEFHLTNNVFTEVIEELERTNADSIFADFGFI